MSQVKSSSDCGYFCAYIAAQVNAGTDWRTITYTPQDVYAFRNAHGTKFHGPSPKDYVGMNFATAMPPFLKLAGVTGYRVHSLIKQPAGTTSFDLLAKYTEKRKRDVTFVALNAMKHWILRLQSTPEYWTFYDSAAVVLSGSHVFRVRPELVKQKLGPYFQNIVVR
ncbi:hypothetical protein [Actibacterium sp. 188UL27-1]|uniref:hypothetical protein n=1 Tax=Actibacterium sp. 188UL27-1 TaxID=2786961 RepID=UPI00195D1E8D|nr:hypothetical protein [Actibacterium sp. 188UL27-1]MBM7068256.1 hypothetical protein [Actibacterium sp. 188UL27-1]